MQRLIDQIADATMNVMGVFLKMGYPFCDTLGTCKAVFFGSVKSFSESGTKYRKGYRCI